MNNIEKHTHGGKRKNSGRDVNPNPETNKEYIVRFRIDSETNHMLEKQPKSFLCHQGMELMFPYLGKWNKPKKKWEPFEIRGTDANLIAYNAISFAIQTIERRRDADGDDGELLWTEEEKSLHALLSKQWDELRAHKTFWEPKLPG